MEVAVRKPSKKTSIALWRHKFYTVYTRQWREKPAKKDVEIYQALLELRKGLDMPVECRAGLSAKQCSDIWVHGVYYASASVIRKTNIELRKDRYIFQKDNSDDWEPCPQYKAALGKCPKLVRVENCLCWTPMSDVLHTLPRVVHPVGVVKHEICVNGRDWHYLCGVICQSYTEQYQHNRQDSRLLRQKSTGRKMACVRKEGRGQSLSFIFLLPDPRIITGH
jgi:hypothetical protein